MVAVAQAVNDNELATSLFVKSAKECERLYFLALASSHGFRKADDGVRTRDPQLGMLMLYHLSYVRAAPRVAGRNGAGGAQFAPPADRELQP